MRHHEDILTHEEKHERSHHTGPSLILTGRTTLLGTGTRGRRRELVPYSNFDVPKRLLVFN